MVLCSMFCARCYFFLFQLVPNHVVERRDVCFVLLVTTLSWSLVLLRLGLFVCVWLACRPSGRWRQRRGGSWLVEVWWVGVGGGREKGRKAGKWVGRKGKGGR